MWQPGALSRTVLALIWLVLGIAMVAVAVWLGWTRWPAILNGHPAMLIAGIGCGLFGFIAIAWAIGSLTIGDRQDREGDPGASAAPNVQVKCCGEPVGGSFSPYHCWCLPFCWSYSLPTHGLLWRHQQPQGPCGRRAVCGVADRPSWYELIPVREDPSGKDIKPTTGLMFTPGARIDSRAYAHVLRPLAEAGYLVVVLKEPFGFSLLDADRGSKRARPSS